MAGTGPHASATAARKALERCRAHEFALLHLAAAADEVRELLPVRSTNSDESALVDAECSGSTICSSAGSLY